MNRSLSRKNVSLPDRIYAIKVKVNDFGGEKEWKNIISEITKLKLNNDTLTTDVNPI